MKPMSADAANAGTGWLLLIHSIPPKPDYFRVKIGRRLQRVGAVAVKASVYALPDREELYEDFQWIRSEIVDGGGDASIVRAEFLDALTSEQLQQTFRAVRDAEYKVIIESAHATLKEIRRATRQRHGSTARVPVEEIEKLHNSFAATLAIDFFDAPKRGAAEHALNSITAMQTAPAQTTADKPASRSAYRNRTCVTRRDVFVDRMASAWLIRRFIDPKARFKFVKADGYRPAKGEVRFDMFGGEFTHRGDACSFETLVARFALKDQALHELAEIVHDIDVKDGKFVREEARGVARLLSGIVATYKDDATRLKHGAALFNSLYVAFSTPQARARFEK